MQGAQNETARQRNVFSYLDEGVSGNRDTADDHADGKRVQVLEKRVKELEARLSATPQPQAVSVTTPQERTQRERMRVMAD